MDQMGVSEVLEVAWEDRKGDYIQLEILHYTGHQNNWGWTHNTLHSLVLGGL